MRGAFDFEAWEWTNPLCCGFTWGPPEARERFFLKDPAPHVRPHTVAPAALRFMLEQDGVTQWWAHNMGKYDGLFMLEAAALEMGWKAHGHVAGGSRLIYLAVRPPGAKRSVHLYDSFAVFSDALRKVAEDFELPSRKLFTKDDYRQDPRTWDPTRLKTGCLTDCDLVLEALEKGEKLIEAWGGQLRSTFSASALSIIKAKLAEQGLELPSHADNQDLNAFCRGGFYGGRVEVLHHVPQGWLREYDLNSSYPASMCKVLPWELLGNTTTESGVQRILSGEREGVIRARVSVPHSMRFPPLPWRSPDGGIYFPTGEWEASFAAPELRYAMELGCKVEPLDGVAYTSRSPFASFVDEVYKLKSSAPKGALRAFTKFLLNGCYGKFGQVPEQETLFIAESDDAARMLALKCPLGTVGQLGKNPRFLTLKKTHWPKHTHFAIAAYVTAYSRIALHQGMLRCPGVAYVDTDSLHVPEAQTLPEDWLGAGLGQWKVELPRYTAEFFAPKLYRLIEPPITKGVEGPRGPGGLPPSYSPVHLAAKGFPVTWSDFHALTELEAVRVERMQLATTQLRQGGRVKRLEKDNAELKSWKGHSTKRRPLPDGSTSPWTVQELQNQTHEDAVSPLALPFLPEEEWAA